MGNAFKGLTTKQIAVLMKSSRDRLSPLILHLIGELEEGRNAASAMLLALGKWNIPAPDGEHTALTVLNDVAVHSIKGVGLLELAFEELAELLAEYRRRAKKEKDGQKQDPSRQPGRRPHRANLRMVGLGTPPRKKPPRSRGGRTRAKDRGGAGGAEGPPEG